MDSYRPSTAEVMHRDQSFSFLPFPRDAYWKIVAPWYCQQGFSVLFEQERGGRFATLSAKNFPLGDNPGVRSSRCHLHRFPSALFKLIRVFILPAPMIKMAKNDWEMISPWDEHWCMEISSPSLGISILSPCNEDAGGSEGTHLHTCLNCSICLA